MRLSLLLLPAAFAAYQFDNALRGEPKMQCYHDHVALSFETEKDRPAHVFVKGHFRKEGCSFANTTSVVIDFEKCDVNRKRMARGIEYDLPVTVQLHPLFVTKVDRMFQVKCAYHEMDKEVGTRLGVEDLQPKELDQAAALPTCTYSLHKDSANGPLVKFAKVGDVIYHVWDCPSDVYAMKVHSCRIADGSGLEQEVIDVDGCTTDEHLIPELTYSSDLTKTFAASNAFMIPDQSSVYFNCKIQHCVKGSEGCSLSTPPKCGINRNTETGDLGLGKQLDDDQVFTVESTTASSTTTTTRAPSTTSTSTTTTPQPTTTASIPVTTTTVLSTTVPTVVTTTVTEITGARSAVPTTTTIVLPPRDFPAPSRLPEENNTLNDNVEGSGLEITPSSTPVALIVADQVSHKEIYIRPGDVTPPDVSSDSDLTGRRELKRRDTVVDVDISSPEITIVDREFGMPDAPEALRQENESRGSSSPSVCVPLVGFWAVSALCVVCCSVVAVSICYAQRQRNKFRMLP